MGGSTSGGSVASGGTVNSGGKAASGGSATSGGMTSSGGRDASGGSSESGSTSRGGSAGTSGSSGMSGSSGASGAQQGGGPNGGMGGGGAGGNTAQGGAAGTTAGGSGGAGSDTTIAGKFDGALITYPCGTSHGGYDCDNVGCSNNQVTHTQMFQLGGDSGKVYNVTFRVRGIVEAYNYVGGERDAGNDSVKTNPDLFLRGGAPQQSGANGYDYDVYELDVAPAVSGSPSTFFLNSVINSENPHTSSTTQHMSFKLDYTKTIKVQGGGTITVKQFDSNCKSIMNCGPTAGNTCAAPRTIELSDATPAPSNFMQPYQMPSGAYGQWLFFDVTSVTPAP